MFQDAEKLAYVTNTGTDENPSNTVSVIDTVTDKVIDTIKVGNAPIELAITPNGKKVYVANREDNSVSVINTANNKVIDTITVGETPILLAITPDGTRAYVGNGEETTQESSISVIDMNSNTVTDDISVRFFPIGIAMYNKEIADTPVGVAPIDVTITPDGTTVYVTNVGDDTVSAIDTGTNFVTSIPVGVGPAGVGIGNTPFGMRAFVINSDDDSISVIDTLTNKIINKIKVGNVPNLVAVGRVCRLVKDD